MPAKVSATNWLLGLVGAAIGGVIGYFVFDFIVKQGFLALVLPGAFVGLGCGALSGVKSNALGIVAGVLGLFLGIFCEWNRAPFVADDSLSYFVTHIHENPATILIMMAFGGVLAYWFGIGRDGGVWRRRDQGAA